MLVLVPAILVAVRHRNCHVKGCWRLGHPDPKHGHPACKHHHTQKHLLGTDPHKAKPSDGASTVADR